MSLPEPHEITSHIQGTWLLPITDDYTVNLALIGTGRFIYTISAATPMERARQILVGDEIFGNWQIRSRRKPSRVLASSAGRAVRGSVGLMTGSVAPPTQRGDVSQAGREENGPFLVLNFTELPKSRLNFRVAGFALDLANWLNDLREIVSNDYLKIVELTDTTLSLRGRRGVEVWRRVQAPILGA